MLITSSLLLICSTLSAVHGRSHDRLIPVHYPQNAEIIPNEYIVTLTEPGEFQGNHEEYVDQHLRRVFGDSMLSPDQLLHKYELGYSAVFSSHDMARLRSMPDIEFIEANQVVSIIEPIQEDHVQEEHNWGLDRICKRDLPLDNEYHYPTSAGEGVDVYVIDTGINIEHEDFEGRAFWGYTAPRGDEDEDGNGHGTHVASTIVGKNYGVAKKSNIFAVKVLRSSGYGSMSDVLKGVEWAAKRHIQKSSSEKKTKSVANMSLGGGHSPALDRAVSSAVKKGVLFAVAAGNDDRNACDYSPAASEDAITVGATTKEDSRAWFSNWGECVDIFAPGHLITAAWKDSKTETKTISGTSMASPHVAGVMALFAAEGDYTPAELKKMVLKMASVDKLQDIGEDSPNKMLFNNAPSMHRERGFEKNVQSAMKLIRELLLTFQAI